MRAIVVSMLRRQGYRVLAAQSAEEALHLCERHPEPVDLLLTDVVMPRMNGPELAHRLSLDRPEMKALFVSGYTDDTDDSAVRQGVVATGAAFLQKPVTPASLTTKVREVLDAAPVEPPSQAR